MADKRMRNNLLKPGWVHLLQQREIPEVQPGVFSVLTEIVPTSEGMSGIIIQTEREHSEEYVTKPECIKITGTSMSQCEKQRA
jgi:hypothetical protein